MGLGTIKAAAKSVAWDPVPVAAVAKATPDSRSANAFWTSSSVYLAIRGQRKWSEDFFEIDVELNRLS